MATACAPASRSSRYVLVFTSRSGEMKTSRFAVADRGDGFVPIVRRERAVEPHGRDADPGEAIHLVLHQGDERRDDDRQAVADDGRRLVAERLAAAGRHDDERIAAGEHRMHRLVLQRPQRAEPPVRGNRRKHVVGKFRRHVTDGSV